MHVQSGEEEDPINRQWEELILNPLRSLGKPLPRLVVLKSPFRYILQPLVGYVHSICPVHKTQRVCVLVPELVVQHWWQNAMHNRRADMLKVLLLMQGNKNIVVINVPWYLQQEASMHRGVEGAPTSVADLNEAGPSRPAQ